MNIQRATNQNKSSAKVQPRTARIVRIIDRLNVGGPAKHVVWLSRGLAERGFETTLITGTVPEGEGDMSYFAREARVTPLVLKEMSRELSFRDVVVIANLVRQLFRLKPDIIHTHKAKAGATGRVAAMVYKWLTASALWLKPRECKIVHTFHGHIFHSYYGPVKTRLFVAIERVLARLCTDRIVTVSEQQRGEICEEYHVGKPEQFRVIPLGIELPAAHGAEEKAKAFRAELGVAQGELLIGSVGRLCEVKNYFLFLDAADRLINRFRGSRDCPRFVLIGDGHLRPKLEQRARESGIEDRFSFTGFRDDAVSLYPALDIVALTSLNEGTPLTLIEAMACSRPVVATEVGGVIDIMGQRRPGGNGFSLWDHGLTAPSGDANAFAAALEYLVRQQQLRREMGVRGQSFVRLHLSQARLLADIESLYLGLIGMQQAPSMLSNRAQGSNYECEY